MLEQDALGIDVDPAHELIYTSAERIRLACDSVPEDQARAGDLVFFMNTYPTAGASHLGIVLDPVNKTMLDDHERSPTRGPGVTNYASAYWHAHLMAYGRIRQ